MQINQKKSVRNRYQASAAAIESLESRQLLTASLSFNPLPFGTNQIVPASNYDTGGEGVSYHDTTSADLGNAPSYRPGSAVDVSTGGTRGHIVTFTQTGEYLVYSLVVPTTATYQVQSSAANTSDGGLFHVEFNGVNETGDFSNPNTGSFTKFLTQTSAPFSLNAGTYKMKVVVDAVGTTGAGGNLNWFCVEQTPPAPPGTELPYSSTPPGSGVNIPFVNYDKGGYSVAYSTTTAINYGNSSYRNNTSVCINSGGVSGNVVGFTTATEYLNYTINLPSGGTYTLNASTSNTAGGAIFHLSEGGVNLTGSLAVATTASFSTYATVVSPVFKLPAGRQVIRIAFDKAATNGAVGNFDYFKLVPTAAPTDQPFTTPFAPNAVIPAANYDKGGEGVSYHDTTPSNLGNDTYRAGDGVDLKTGGTTGHLVAFTAVGEWLQYTVTVTTAGSFKFQASAANPGTGAAFHVAEGATNVSGTITITPTTDYNTFATDSSAAFTLSAGTHILRVFFDTAASNGAVGNFDWFKLISA